MATLNSNVLLRNPETGEKVVLLAGTEVPEWAQEAIGEHLTAFTLPSEKPIGDGTTPDNDEIPAEPEGEETGEETDGEEIEETYADLTKEELKAEAKARGLSGYGSANKEELVALLEEDDAIQAETEED